MTISRDKEFFVVPGLKTSRSAMNVAEWHRYGVGGLETVSQAVCFETRCDLSGAQLVVTWKT